jgi:hypothetical protein
MPPADQPRIDTSRPSIARVYDVFLGGKDNYEVEDRSYCQDLCIKIFMLPWMRSGQRVVRRACR